MTTPIGISASRSSAILGLSSWQTPVQVWLQIMEERHHGFCAEHNYLLPVIEDNASMRWGRAFESAIIDLCEQKSDKKIIDLERYYYSDLITCHIDGMYNDVDRVLHEGKTTTTYYFRDNFGEPGTDRVPVEYQIQCQHEMICTGSKKVILSVLVFPRRPEEWEGMGIAVTEISCEKWASVLNEMGYFHQYEITSNPELQNLMLDKYKNFFNNNVIIGNPPEPQSYDDIKALVRDPVGTIVADDDMIRLMSEYHQIKTEISSSGILSKRAEEIKVSALEYMRQNGAILDDDSRDKWIMRDATGKKIATYGKNKNGILIFR